MNSLFNDSAIETIKRIKKIFLWTAVSILIGEIVVCAILILAQNFNETIGRLMGSFAVCAIMMFFGVNNFSRMEKGDRIVQSFALVSLIGNIIWLLLSFLFIWNVVPYMESLNKYPYYSMSIVARIFVVAIDIAVMCFLISNVWSIKETVKPVRPLKITAIICALYCGIYSVVVTVGDVRSVMDQRWYALAGLAGFAFVIMGIAASTISNSGAKKGQGEVGAGVANIDKKEVQAKIQEMVEKEVQERLAAEKNKAELEVTPPPQDDNKKSTVSHDGDVDVSDESTVEELQPAQDESTSTQELNDEVVDSFDKGGDDPNNKEM